jgi:hypothetical protein
MAARARPISTFSDYPEHRDRDGNALEQLYEEIFGTTGAYLLGRPASYNNRSSRIYEPPVGYHEGGLDVLSSSSRRASQRLSIIDASTPAPRWSESSTRPPSLLPPPVAKPKQLPPRSLWTVLARFAPAHEKALLVLAGFFAAAAGLARPMTSIILGNVRLVSVETESASFSC